MITIKYKCRVCSSTDLKLIWDFGNTPLANSYMEQKDLGWKEETYPLQVNQCNKCSNLQLAHVIDPDILFKYYDYASSISPVFIKHFEDFAAKMCLKLNLHVKDLVVDIGSNDGILLRPFQALDLTVLGVDPAKNIESKGINTIHEYFTKDLATSIVQDYGRAKLITATNVFAHIDNLDEIIDGVKTLLHKKGLFVIEVADLDIMLKDGTFDLIYHEHVNYWNEKSIRTFFNLRDMEVVEIERVPVHGGSLRVYARVSK